MTHIDQFIEALFYRASDDNAEVKIVVSLKYLHILKVYIIMNSGFPQRMSYRQAQNPPRFINGLKIGGRAYLLIVCLLL